MSERLRIEVSEAAALIDARMPTAAARRVPLADASGEILRERVVAERDQPPFDRVTMDGIAIDSRALAAKQREFRIAGTQGAGAAPIALGGVENCVEIMTGAKLPDDADTIVPVERIVRANDRAILADDYQPEPGQFVHRRASDHAGGDELLQPGTHIGPAEMAVLTIGGRADVAIAARPRIALISTGDELVGPGRPITDFQVRSSNGLALAAALGTRGFNAVSQAHLPDEPRRLRTEIAQLHDSHDVLILSGGVSMGKYDYVPDIMRELGIELVFHKVLQRPGLPMWFGVSRAGRPVFALPGNPVSSLVCLVRYVRPGLLAGLGATPPRERVVPLSEPVQFTPDLTWFLPVQLESATSGHDRAVPRPTNTSGDFVSLAGTHGFVELPRGRNDFPAGFAARFFAW